MNERAYCRPLVMVVASGNVANVTQAIPFKAGFKF